MKSGLYRNKHGRLFKVVCTNGMVVVVTQHYGELARWDDHVGFGLLRHTTGVVGRIMEWEEWQVAVKVTATMMRSE